MISVDPNTVTMVGRVREAVRSLKSEMKGLADQAERYARAMGQKTAGWGGGGRPSNFPEPISQQQAYRDRQQWGRERFGGGAGGGGGGGGGRGRFDGGLDPGEERRLITAVLLPQIMSALGGQLGNVIARERTTTRLAMAQTGQYTGPQMAQPWQRMLRGAGGYTSTGDLYAGAGALGQAGLLRAPNDPRTQGVVRETGLAAIMGGTNYQTAAQTVAGFRDPSVVNALRQGMVGGRGITSPFAGGGMQLYGRQGLLEQVYGGLGGNRRSEAFFRTGLAPGGALARTLGAAGMSAEQQQLIQQYGIARAERATAHPGETDEQAAAAVQKDLEKRYKDTGETLRQFQESVSDLRDVFVTGLLPIVQGLVMVLKPLAKTIRTVGENFPIITKALGAATAALVVFTITTKLAATAQKWGAAGAAAGLPGGGLLGGAGGLLGRAAAPLAMAAGGYVLGEGVQGLVSGGQTEGGRATAGRALGGALTGAGIGAAVGSVVPVIGTAVGAGVGAAIGGVAGLFGIGDAWDGWGDGEPDKPQGGGAVSGKDLRGAKSSDTNMNPEFAKKLQAMFADNPNLSLTSGWRDPATQARLYREKPNLAAPPGKSNHEKGTAADIGPPSEYGWIAANLGKYGLFLPMPNTAERKAKGKKIEPWHVEPAGGGAAAATSGTPVTAATPTAPTQAKAAAKAVSPEVRSSTSIQGGAGAYNEASAAAAILGGAQIGDNWEGDNTVVFPYTTGGGAQSRGGSGNITIGRIEINLTIARGTPEEAERTARYLGTLLGDRERMLTLARGGKG
jgi:hypothetical protein